MTEPEIQQIPSSEDESDFTISDIEEASISSLGSPKKKSKMHHAHAPGRPRYCTDRLFQLVLSNDWGKVLSHCETHPEDARYKDVSGQKPLYAACDGRLALVPSSSLRVSVLKALIKAHPLTLLDACEYGCKAPLPIHALCHSGPTKDLLKEMLHMYPHLSFTSREEKLLFRGWGQQGKLRTSQTPIAILVFSMLPPRDESSTYVYPQTPLTYPKLLSFLWHNKRVAGCLLCLIEAASLYLCEPLFHDVNFTQPWLQVRRQR